MPACTVLATRGRSVSAATLSPALVISITRDVLLEGQVGWSCAREEHSMNNQRCLYVRVG